MVQDRDDHLAHAKAANNAVYPLLDRTDRSPDDDAFMVHQAHAAAYHWSVVGGPVERARAEYLCARVHAFLGHGEAALRHADRAMALVVGEGLDGFDLAYAHEGRARALAALSRTAEAGAELGAAWNVEIPDPEDKAIVVADLQAGPWYGVEPGP